MTELSLIPEQIARLSLELSERMAVPMTKIEIGDYCAKFHKSLINRGMFTPGTQARITEWIHEGMTAAVEGEENK